LKFVNPATPPEQSTVKEPADLVFKIGCAAPAVVSFAVRRIIELGVARGFVTVVLEPVTATVPKELGLRPEEAVCSPSHEGPIDAIST
jgi:hypothetical protein